MFAVIKTGGKQYRVTAGTKLKIEKLETAGKDTVTFSDVLLKADGDVVTVGKPTISGAKVEAKVLNQGRHAKLIVFKYRHKTRRRTKNGHRQPFTEVEITGIK